MRASQVLCILRTRPSLRRTPKVAMFGNSELVVIVTARNSYLVPEMWNSKQLHFHTYFKVYGNTNFRSWRLGLVV
jgi:hypothetical protein